MIISIGLALKAAYLADILQMCAWSKSLASSRWNGQ